ncbi:hypothetical protein GCM10010377_48860 [Streptomyces viridiviolaceus]|nr:hypothetical protein GCM10010377_48860 [Streptomyces viridiviolaceus]
MAAPAQNASGLKDLELPRATNRHPQPTAVPRPLDAAVHEESSSGNGAPGSPTSAELVSAGSDGETPRESVALPGAVSTMWSSILSTACHRLGGSR